MNVITRRAPTPALVDVHLLLQLLGLGLRGVRTPALVHVHLLLQLLGLGVWGLGGGLIRVEVLFVNYLNLINVSRGH